jgi:hypothetical protein
MKQLNTRIFIFVLSDMRRAPIAAGRTIPQGASAPAASGIAKMLYPAAHPSFWIIFRYVALLSATMRGTSRGSLRTRTTSPASTATGRRKQSEQRQISQPLSQEAPSREATPVPVSRGQAMRVKSVGATNIRKWVYVLWIAAIAVVVLFIVLHLTGHVPRGH